MHSPVITLFFSLSICSVRLKKSWKSSAYDKIEIKTVHSLMTEQTNDHACYSEVESRIKVTRKTMQLSFCVLSFLLTLDEYNMIIIKIKRTNFAEKKT